MSPGVLNSNLIYQSIIIETKNVVQLLENDLTQYALSTFIIMCFTKMQLPISLVKMLNLSTRQFSAAFLRDHFAIVFRDFLVLIFDKCEFAEKKKVCVNSN